jgi:hypothetical protein
VRVPLQVNPCEIFMIQGMDTCHASSCGFIQTSSPLTKTVIMVSYVFNETTGCGSSDLTKMWLSNNKLFTVEKRKELL